MSPTVENRGVRGMTTPLGGRAMRSQVALTSSAVKSPPSWNFTPFRRWKVYFFPSGAMSHFQARSGMMVCPRSEEHTSELQSRLHLVCRLLLEKKKKQHKPHCTRANYE